MPVKHLTDRFVSSVGAADGKRVEYRDRDLKGLALRVTPSGAKSWTLRYRTNDGAQKRLTLGAYPDISLAKARAMTEKTRGTLVDGRDPVSEKKVEKQEAVADRLRTLNGLAQQYFEDAAKGRHKPNGRPKRDQTLKLEIYYYNRLLKPNFGDSPITSLKRVDIQTFVNKTADHVAPSAARQCRNVIRQLFSYAVFLELADANPAMKIQVPAAEPRERVISNDELQKIWNAFEHPEQFEILHLSREMALALQLTAVTLQRGGEIVGLHTRELNLDDRIWTIPGSRTKNRRTHVVPLSDMAISIITEAINLQGSLLQAHDRYIFPSPRGGGPITRHALTRAMKRVARAADVQSATPHDLRRTGATNLTSEEIGVDRFIVSRVLNHVSDSGNSSAVTAVYDRNEYAPQKRKALGRWADKLQRIVSGSAGPDRVVQLRQHSAEANSRGYGGPT